MPNGYAIIYYYDHQDEMNPNLTNSWNTMYDYAKQQKQNNFFQKLINNIKDYTYITIIE